MAFVVGVALLGVLVPVGRASAHPLGNFTVSQYDGVVVAPGTVRVDHVEDLAEIPARQVRGRVDADGDGDLGAAELRAWARSRCDAAARGARAAVDGRAVPVRAGAAAAFVRPGQAGLATLRVECSLAARAAVRGGARVAYRPAEAAAGPGWREITARGDRMTLTASDAPPRSTSRRLTTYPQDLLSSPPEQRALTATVAAGGPALDAAEPEAAGAASGVLPRGADRWTQALTSLVDRHELGFGVGAVAFATALVLGALHALAPGHGKTLMAAAAAAGGRGSRRQLVALGTSITVTHTLGVFVLGAMVIAGSAATPAVVSWLGIAGGVLVAAAGGLLLRRAWRRQRRERHRRDGHHHHHHHAPPMTPRAMVLLGFAGGLAPSPSAVVVLVGAAALGRVWFGALLVTAYGVGLALTLTAAGFAAVRLGGGATALGRRWGDGRGGGRGRLPRLPDRLRRAAPFGSATAVLALGCGLVLKGAAAALS